MGARSNRACRRLKRATVSLAPALLAIGFLAGVGPARGDDPSQAALIQTAPPAAAAPAEDAELAKRLNGLVTDLGADEYFVREKAQRELQRLGIVAFDAVYEAADHEDIEIAHRAKYLVATIEIDWVEDRDSDAVKTILSRYEDAPTDEREKSVLRLSELPVDEALEPLTRIARFEPSESLSRLAVLQLMDLTSDKELDEAQRVAMGERLALLSGSGKRPSSRWLAAHAMTLKNPAESVDAWDKLIQEDLDLYHRRPELTDPNVVAQLLKRHGELLLSLDRKEDAYASLRRLFQVIPSEPSSVLLNVRWLVEREAWPVVLDAETRYAAMFQQDVGLAYCAAEAHAATGDDEGVQQILERIANDSIEAPRRIEIAEELERWGRFDWAEREYRQGMKGLAPPNPAFGWAARRFAEMLHDQERDAEAAEILATYLKALDEDEQFRSILIDQFEWPIAEHRARQATFRGLALQAEGKLAEARETFEKGFADYEFDADLLIAMYRTPDASPEWRESTKKRVEAATVHFKAEIAAARQEHEIASRAGNAKAAQTTLALNCNQYAWLVGNTFGDFDDAVRRSEESLEIAPDARSRPGYLDTLARALFSRGDVERAIATQREALESDPHSGAMNRQLREFEAAVSQDRP